VEVVVPDSRVAISEIALRWLGKTVVVAASGPSLTKETADACKGVLTVCVNDAHRLFPWAEVLYACDAAWWHEYDGVLEFLGERCSSHSSSKKDKNDKQQAADRWGLKLVEGRHGNGFSTNPAFIHYGENSGFQAINLAILFGARRLLLVGFDMHNPNGKRHFFGNHPKELRNSDPRVFIKNFVKAANPVLMPKGVQIINCTPGSALECFPRMALKDALVT
jgi:hypothetical protein